MRPDPCPCSPHRRRARRRCVRPAGRRRSNRPEGFEADRRAILAMAGNYRVRFDMRETTSWRSDYTPLAASTSGGHEIVRVIADTGRFISLQHILVMGTAESPVVIKHWRQDWTYEPETVPRLCRARISGRSQRVPAAERRGAWSQTVWQVDDSPALRRHRPLDDDRRRAPLAERLELAPARPPRCDPQPALRPLSRDQPPRAGAGRHLDPLAGQ